MMRPTAAAYKGRTGGGRRKGSQAPLYSQTYGKAVRKPPSPSPTRRSPSLNRYESFRMIGCLEILFEGIATMPDILMRSVPTWSHGFHIARQTPVLSVPSLTINPFSLRLFRAREMVLSDTDSASAAIDAFTYVPERIIPSR